MSLGSASLSSSAFFTPAINAFNDANKALADSTVKLSSGSRITRAGDDVAAFSIATRMQSQLVTLKQASTNAAQGNSLLQVAQGGLQQISDLLDKMNAIATQSSSSAITNVDRSYLQTQFAGYKDEIDRIARTTNFNNISLLNGNLSGESKPTTTTNAATKAQATLLFNATPATGETVVLNGVTLTADTDFAVGIDTAATVENLKNALNNSTDSKLSGATYTRSGDSLVITQDSGGALGNQYIVNKASSTSDFSVAGAATQTTNIYTTTGGTDNGLGYGSTIATGTIGDPVVNTQSQTKGSVTLSLSAQPIANETLNIDNGDGGLVTFTFKASASSSTEVTIGSSVEETLQNLVAKVSQYSGTDNFVTRQLDFQINGNNLIISNKTAGNATDFASAAPDITETITNGTLSAATITGGTNTGINTNGVNNSAFVGKVTGFSATYNSADNVTASITVGSSTYTANISDTTPASNSTVRFTSSNGGYFDVQLAGGAGHTVGDQTTANAYAANLNAAIGGLTFSQSRNISNFSSTGAFSGASAKLQDTDFTDNRIDSIKVTAPTGGDATIDISINGETYRASSGIGSTLGAYETLKFTNLNNANETLTLTNGSSAQNFSDAANAATFQSNLRTAFGLDSGGSGANFQVGTNTNDTVNVVVNSSTTDKLFNGTTPDVSTQSNATTAQGLIATARNSVLANLANVGALQARFDSAQAVNSKISEGVISAHSQLADTDIAEESTNYALQVLKVNSSIAILAQTHKLQSSLLNVLQQGLGG